MSLPFNIPENVVLLQGLVAQIGTGADVNSRPISLKMVHKVWIYANISTLAGAAYAVTPQTDSLVAFGTPAALTVNVPIWFMADADTNTTWTRATDATHYDTAGDANPKALIFEIDPAKLPAGEDCLRLDIPALAAADRASVEYLIVPRYQDPTNVNFFVD